MSGSPHRIVVVFASICMLACAESAPRDPEPSSDRAQGAAAGASAPVPEPPSLLETSEFKQCVAEAPRSGWTGDSLVILDLAPGTAMDDAVALVERNGHSLVDRWDAVRYLSVDVGEPEAVFPWTCRYVMDEAMGHAFRGVWANTNNEVATTD